MSLVEPPVLFLHDPHPGGGVCWFDYLNLELGRTMWRRRRDGTLMSFSMTLLADAGGLRGLLRDWQMEAETP